MNKNDDNDSFDEAELLKQVPQSQIEKAKRLVQFFNRYPEEISWNSEGVIFLDETSIPNSNIYQIFPLLYSNSPLSKSLDKPILNSLLELLKKIKELHLDHLILRKVPDSVEKVYKRENNLEELSSNDSDDYAWWFIGS